MNGPRIAVLPPPLADQIAAGEVVERPASVVKELIENALDAGARRIDVEIEEGGLSLIRVTDDGGGMTPEEAHLSLKRHATSKLRRAEDLFSLSTMGFRGEALPSIAAVSRLVLTTRTAEAMAAYRLAIEAGLECGPGKDIGAKVGTQVEVRDLLYNVPARLKFLKGQPTENGHIAEALLRVALGFPQVHFKLTQNGKVALDLPPHPGARERAQAALGSRGRRSGPPMLYPALGEEAGVKVEAYLGVPADSTTTPRNVYLLVNRRYIRDRSLLHAAMMGYGELIDRGRYPLLVLHVSLVGEQVDINVHPQKLEVRFAQPQAVYAAVRHAVRDAAQKAPWLVESSYGQGPARIYELDEPDGAAEARPAYGASGEAGERPPVPAPMPGGIAAGSMGGMGGSGGAGLHEHRERVRQALGLRQRNGVADEAAGTGRPDGEKTQGGTGQLDLGRMQPDAGPTPDHAGPADPAVVPTATAPPRIISGAAASKTFFSSMEYLSQLHETYLVCLHEGELVLIDQHAAHERLAFERLRASHAKAQIRSQRLLFPLSIELDPLRAALVEEHEGTLAALGFDVRPFGGHSFGLLAGPDAGEFGRGGKIYQDPERLLQRVLDELETHGRSDMLAARLELILATIACHSVVRAGDVLSETQARTLLQSMDEFAFVPHCPHGRPVLSRMPRAEIEKKFGRT